MIIFQDLLNTNLKAIFLHHFFYLEYTYNKKKDSLMSNLNIRGFSDNSYIHDSSLKKSEKPTGKRKPTKQAAPEKMGQVIPYKPKSNAAKHNPNAKAIYNGDGDVVEFKKAASTNPKAVVTKGIAGVLAAAMLYAGGAKFIDKMTPADPNFNAGSHNVEQVSTLTSVDERAILLANTIDSKEAALGEIVLPTEYEMYSDEISELNEKLQDDKLSDKKKEQCEEKLNDILSKQEKQNELATVYVDSDGKYAYILPKESGIYAEDIKEAFGIKDGVIRNYNSNLEYSWGEDGTEDMPGYYKDYTYSTIPYEGIKVPFDSLKK